jgi:ribosomal protein S3AE
VGQERTFAIKTQDKYMVHTCLKSLTNKSANSKWVSKEVVKLMHTSQKVMIRDIIQHMMTKFALNITPNTAWKAKQYATAIVEGDADRQYSLLRRYAEELRSKCKHNTVKIGVERPIPSDLHPRFITY